MLFNSAQFIFIFLPVTLFVFFLTGRIFGYRAATTWLVSASLFFYGYWNPVYLILILSSMFWNFWVGILINSAHDKNNPAKAKWLLILGISFNLFLLGYFKYANFFSDSVNYVLSTNWELSPIILPLAISFFTFQQIAYLVDTYRKETDEHDFIQYALFVTFFPQLIAGPIVHHKEMLPQFSRPSIYQLSYSNLAAGSTIFIIGLFKKVFIADQMALIATPVFIAAEQPGSDLHFFQAWGGVGAYTIQLYFDFSGYSDMAIGLARMFGIRLPLNFNSPYQATSIIDFWRRWHMTLSRFLRDYVYFALGGNRKGKTQRYTNLFITMLLGGLWHGAGWTFVLWGGLHGFYLVCNHVWRYIWKRRINRWWSITIARLITLLFVMLGWIFFRAESLQGAQNIIQGMCNLPHTLQGRIGSFETLLVNIGFQFNGPKFGEGNLKILHWGIIWLLVIWFTPNTQQFMANWRPAFRYKPGQNTRALLQSVFSCLYWRPTRIWACWVTILAILGLLNLNRVSEFIYFQF